MTQSIDKQLRRRVLGRVEFGLAIPKLEGGWYNEYTGEWGDYVIN